MPGEFVAFSTEHVLAVLTFILATMLLIIWGNRVDDVTKKRIGFSIAMAAFLALAIESIYKLSSDTYDVLGDLPLFLCDIAAFGLPLVIWYHNRKWIGILYFWALAGTLQALITPELHHGFPSFHFFRYFLMHAGIVSAVIYTVIVFKVFISWKDFWRAILYAQIYLMAVHLINLILKSNYSYTVRKPRTSTILDYLGEWPVYLLGGEILMILLFFILMMPFLFRRFPKTGLAEREPGD
jgi:hypothetical integral membrane protein (TIGR02206 family)